MDPAARTANQTSSRRIGKSGVARRMTPQETRRGTGMPKRRSDMKLTAVEEKTRKTALAETKKTEKKTVIGIEMPTRGGGENESQTKRNRMQMNQETESLDWQKVKKMGARLQSGRSYPLLEGLVTEVIAAIRSTGTIVASLEETGEETTTEKLHGGEMMTEKRTEVIVEWRKSRSASAANVVM
jgi:hypothetical protein